MEHLGKVKDSELEKQAWIDLRRSGIYGQQAQH